MNAALHRRPNTPRNGREIFAARYIAVFAVACLFLSACAPASTPLPAGPSVQEMAGTMAAATLSAAATSTALAITSIPPTPTATTQPTLFINAATSSCRSGPSPDFQVIATYNAGTTVNLVGNDSADSYWIVQDPASGNRCWISVQEATPGGSFDTLPEMTPQPVTGDAPGKPAKGVWNYACDNTTLTMILGWRPTTGTVNGYRIFRQGNQIADVPASQTSYTEKVPFRYGSSMQYAVTAYNQVGMSPPLNWDFHCP